MQEGLLCHSGGCCREEDEGQRAQGNHTEKIRHPKTPAVTYDVEEWM